MFKIRIPDEKGEGVLAKYELEKFDWQTKVRAYIVMRAAVTSHDGNVLLREDRSTRAQN